MADAEARYREIGNAAAPAPAKRARPRRAKEVA
jgi:hypothetical protein